MRNIDKIVGVLRVILVIYGKSKCSISLNTYSYMLKYLNIDRKTYGLCLKKRLDTTIIKY